MQERDPKTGKPVASSAGKFLGWNTIYGRDGEHGTPYMTRVWFWGLRLHIFHRPDLDEDCHDHPWDFTTFPIWPIHGYVEEIVLPTAGADKFLKWRQRVPSFRFSFRPATHCHRVLGAYDKRRSTWEDPREDPSRKIVTLVWRGKANRAWGFLKNREGKWCWVGWRDYVFAGGKDGPCQ